MTATVFGQRAAAGNLDHRRRSATVAIAALAHYALGVSFRFDESM